MSTFEKEHMGTKAVTKTRPRPNLDLKEPPLYRVIYINDSVTTMEFVVQTLIDIFNHTPETAEAVTLKIHEEGSGTAAILPYEMMTSDWSSDVCSSDLVRFNYVKNIRKGTYGYQSSYKNKTNT